MSFGIVAEQAVDSFVSRSSDPEEIDDEGRKEELEHWISCAVER